MTEAAATRTGSARPAPSAAPVNLPGTRYGTS
jgi:hypothetical protein